MKYKILAILYVRMTALFIGKKMDMLFQIKDKSLFRAIFLSTVLFLPFGCRKFVEVGPPKNKLVSESVFSDQSSATSALTAIYSSMFVNADPYSTALITGTYGDELTSYSTSADQVAAYKNSLTPLSGDVGGWANKYYYIYLANALLEGLKDNTKIRPSVINQLIGEAKFIRAFSYFYLTNFFGDVPIVTSTDYTINSLIAKSPQDSVYRQIIQDLMDAESLLNVNYVNETDTAKSNDRIRPNKSAASALLARVYLYTQDWSKAETEASAVLSNGQMYKLSSSLDSVFLTNSAEAIWQLYPALPGFNSYEGYGFALTGAPSSSIDRSTALSPKLLSAFDSADKRRLSWVSSIVANGTTYFFPRKYKINSTSATSISEYTTVIRLAELYLIRSEARLMQSKIDDALSDLNAIRSRAGLLPFSSTNTDSVKQEILHQRQLELFTEWGHRWFDIKRTNSSDSIMTNVAPLKGGTWDSYKLLFPIKQNNIDKDRNLVQNIGYF